MSDALVKRFEAAKRRKYTTWYSHMRECYDYAIPQRETFLEYTPGQKKSTKVYDPTAINGTPKFSNRVQQTVVPAGQQWAKLKAGRNVNEEQQLEFQGESVTMQEALEKITDICFDYIHRSNFDTRMHEAGLDLAVSTGVLTCDYDPENDQLVFDAVPLSDVYLESGPRGTIDGVWREHKMKASNVRWTWPDAELPEKYKAMEAQDPDKEIEVLEGMLFDHKAQQWMLHVVISEDKREIYQENYRDSSPWIPFRWSVVPGEVYGRGPLMQVLPDIKTLNAMSENMLKSAALTVLGAWTGTSDGVFNPYTFRVAPGIVIPVGSNARDNPTLSPLQTSGTIEFHEYEYARRVNTVNDALFANPIGTMDDPTKTATELTIRRQMDLEHAGASFGRLMVELAGGVIRRVVSILVREGKIPELKLDGDEVDIKYTSPISRLSDLEEAQVLTRAIQMSLGSGVPPEMVVGGIKMEDVPAFLLDKLGGPSELKRSEQERNQLAQGVGAMIGAQQGAEPAA